MGIDTSKEIFKQAELFGKPALFNHSRIDRGTVPENLYCYDLRGAAREPGRPVAVEPHAETNYAGTVITVEPVDSKGGDHRLIRGKLNFTGGESTLREFCIGMGIEYAPRLKYEPRAADESETALFFSRTPEEDILRGCIGHMRFDFGSGGKDFWHTWWEHNGELKTDAFREDLQEVVNNLRECGPLKGLKEMAGFCRSHEKARFRDGRRTESYGFKLESERYSYYLRCFPYGGEYNYLYCYDKSILQMSMAARDRPQAERTNPQSADTQKSLFEAVELDDKEALYTEERVDRGTVPEGIYRYEIRNGDHGVPVLLKEQVETGFGGTILTNEPLDVSGGGMYIEDSLIFTGQERTLSEYMEKPDGHAETEGPRMGGQSQA